MRVVADGARFLVELRAILLVGADVAPFYVAVIRIIVGAHRQVLNDTRRLILHSEKETLVVDREIDPPEVLSVIGPVAELIHSVAELVVDLVAVAEPQNIDRVDVRVSPILLPVQRVTPQGGGVEEQRMIPVVLHQIQRLPDVEKRRRGIPQFLKHQLKLVGCLIPRIDLDLALGLVEGGTGDHQEGGTEQDVFCTLVVC